MDHSHSCTTKMHETIVPHTGERRLLNMFGAQAGSAEGSAERQRQSRPQLGHQCVGGPHLGAPLPCVAGEIPRGAPLPYGVIFHAAPFCIAAPMEESQWGVRNIGRNNTQQNAAQTFWGAACPHNGFDARAIEL